MRKFLSFTLENLNGKLILSIFQGVGGCCRIFPFSLLRLGEFFRLVWNSGGLGVGVPPPRYPPPVSRYGSGGYFLSQALAWSKKSWLVRGSVRGGVRELQIFYSNKSIENANFSLHFQTLCKFWSFFIILRLNFPAINREFSKLRQSSSILNNFA